MEAFWVIMGTYCLVRVLQELFKEIRGGKHQG